MLVARDEPVPVRLRLGRPGPVPLLAADEADPHYRGGSRGPLLDRIDLHIEVAARARERAAGAARRATRPRSSASASGGARHPARALQRAPRRRCNARMRSGDAPAPLRARRGRARETARARLDRVGLSARAHDRVLRSRAPSPTSSRARSSTPSTSPKPCRSARSTSARRQRAAQPQHPRDRARESPRTSLRAPCPANIPGGRHEQAVGEAEGVAGAVGAIEKQFGKGAVMRLGEERGAASRVAGHPDRLASASTSRSGAAATRAGGWSRSSAPSRAGKTTLALHAIAEVQAQAGSRRSSTPSTRST